MNTGSKIGLLKKAYRVWAEEYHYRIPMDILGAYIERYKKEKALLSKYGRLSFCPSDPEQYHQWLKYRTRKPENSEDCSITIVHEKEHAEISGYPEICWKDTLRTVHTDYVCVLSDGIEMYAGIAEMFRTADAYDLVYCDHDCINAEGERTHPYLKPDYSPDTLRGFNYIGRCWVVRTDLLKQFEGEEWNPYRWLLVLSDQQRKFGHVNGIFYGDHLPEASGSAVLEQYLKDSQQNAEVLPNPDGITSTVHYLADPREKISIIIPTKDHIDVLRTCIDSIYAKTLWKNYEVIIVDNNSSLPETADYFEELKLQHDNLKVLRLECPFNFSYINNEAVKRAAEGEIVLFLNNDTSVITPEWLNVMAGYVQQPWIGSAGCLLYYPDDTIQHAGIISGKSGGAAHKYYRAEHDTEGYESELEVPYDVACCTAACLMMKKSRFLELGGFNEELTVNFNDYDLGLRILQKGWFNVFLPDVNLYHYESKSRGKDLTKEQVERYKKEVEYIQTVWKEQIIHDPFYNDLLDKNYDYQLKVE